MSSFQQNPEVLSSDLIKFSSAAPAPSTAPAAASDLIKFSSAAPAAASDLIKFSSTAPAAASDLIKFSSTAPSQQQLMQTTQSLNLNYSGPEENAATNSVKTKTSESKGLTSMFDSLIGGKKTNLEQAIEQHSMEGGKRRKSKKSKGKN